MVGEQQVIRGWDAAIQKLSLGTSAKLTIPPNLAYGKQGIKGVIPPDSTLVFDVELLTINGMSA